ncbi:holo-ACP synthase [Chryseobacterium sp. MYb264]|uniref:holo-ACP synthase n=1 Tax=Chryseobacterium sp. MYb264 TaxID=2745153 RepID=UPI002E16116C|nr:holo-ACP synthase [Chryseobacterium sp. MYb264]
MVIGTDIIKISRIKRLIERKEGNALEFILTANERALKKSPHSVAGIFAAKEALLKAFGIGFSRGLGRLLEIEVKYDPYGKPFLITSGIVKEIQDTKEIRNVELSISHDGDYCVAFVVCI